MKIGLFNGFNSSPQVIDIISYRRGASKSSSSKIMFSHHSVSIDTIMMHIVVRNRKPGISPRVRSAIRVYPSRYSSKEECEYIHEHGN